MGCKVTIHMSESNSERQTGSQPLSSSVIISGVLSERDGKVGMVAYLRRNPGEASTTDQQARRSDICFNCCLPPPSPYPRPAPGEESQFTVFVDFKHCY